jgi:hypothetical protein
MYRRLYYRRQFLLTAKPISILPDWRYSQIGNYHLYAHPDLELTRLADQQQSITIIGHIYDYAAPTKNNLDILNDIAACDRSLGDLFQWLKRYAGRYALFYQDKKNEILIPDALASREIYYSTEENQIICGSQPNLIVKFSNPVIGETRDQDLIDFYKNNLKNMKWDPARKWLGDETCFENVRHLLPNHYLDLKNRKAFRFWPHATILKLGLDDAVALSCSFLQGNIKAMVHRHPVMMAVTAGTDSRALLGSSKGVQSQIYYFINNENLGYNHPDISVPLKIFKSMRIPFHLHNVPADVDVEFRTIFLNNTFFASERILPTIYNIYFKQLENKTNILGLGEIGRTRYGKEPKNLNGYRLAYKLGYKNDYYAAKKSEEILIEMLPAYKKYDINIMTGFYWEQTLGNWGATGNSESDIAIEEINPYNSHKLYEIFLGVNEKFTRYKKNVLFKKMIEYMWPELLNWPINPPIKQHDQLALLLNEMGLFSLLKEVKYIFNYLKYRYKIGS